jgi:hypothetical protein
MRHHSQIYYKIKLFLVGKILKRSAYPFLAVGVSKIVDSLGIPLFADSEKIARQETVLSHDDEVHKEASSSLDHTNLTVGHGDEPEEWKFSC